MLSNRLKFILASLATTLALSACSGIPIQGNRLSEAENYIRGAERALADSRILIARDNLGVANAYLATLKDNRKLLTRDEQKHYHTLLKRAETLNKKLYN